MQECFVDQNKIDKASASPATWGDACSGQIPNRHVPAMNRWKLARSENRPVKDELAMKSFADLRRKRPTLRLQKGKGNGVGRRSNRRQRGGGRCCEKPRAACSSKNPETTVLRSATKHIHRKTK